MKARITIIIEDVDQQDQFENSGEPEIEAKLNEEITAVLLTSQFPYDDIEIDFEQD